MGDVDPSGLHSIANCRRWARAWLARALRLSKSNPQSSQEVSSKEKETLKQCLLQSFYIVMKMCFTGTTLFYAHTVDSNKEKAVLCLISFQLLEVRLYLCGIYK